MNKVQSGPCVICNLTHCTWKANTLSYALVLIFFQLKKWCTKRKSERTAQRLGYMICELKPWGGMYFHRTLPHMCTYPQNLGECVRPRVCCALHHPPPCACMCTVAQNACIDIHKHAQVYISMHVYRYIKEEPTRRKEKSVGKRIQHMYTHTHIRAHTHAMRNVHTSRVRLSAVATVYTHTHNILINTYVHYTQNTNAWVGHLYYWHVHNAHKCFLPQAPHFHMITFSVTKLKYFTSRWGISLMKNNIATLKGSTETPVYSWRGCVWYVSLKPWNIERVLKLCFIVTVFLC